MSGIFAYGYRYEWERGASLRYPVLIRNLCTVGQCYYNSVWENKKIQWGNRSGSSVYQAGQDFGNLQNQIYGIKFKATSVSFKMKCHTVGGSWIETVTQSPGDFIQYLSSTNPIDGIMVRATDGSLHNKTVYVQAHIPGGWLGIISGYDESDSRDGYAGVLGTPIDGLRIFITFTYPTTIPEDSPDNPDDPSETEICQYCGEPLVEGVCQNADCPSNQEEGDYVEE